MKRRLAMLLALSLTFTMLPVGYASAAETQTTEAVEATVEEATNEEAETVEKTEEEAVVEEATVGETTAVVDTTEGQTEEPAAATTVTESTEAGTTEAAAEETEPAEPVIVDETEPAGTGSTEVINHELVENVEPEEAEVTEVTADAKAMWHGFEYNSSGKVIHYWSSGKIKTSVLVQDPSTGKKYYFDENGNPTKNSWKQWKTNWYYLGKDGAAVTGWQTIDGKVFYFGDGSSSNLTVGAMAIGLTKIGSYKYLFADSKNQPKHQLGTRLTGFRQYNGKIYYLVDNKYPAITDTGRMLIGWKTIQGYKYYFGTDGARRTGFQTIGGKTYYFASYSLDKIHTGRIVKGIIKVGSKYYYLDKWGVLKTGWIVKNGVRGWYDSKGAAGKEGWKKKGNEWFYLQENGLARTGWLKLNSNSIYYLDKNKKGAMLVGPNKLRDGKIVFFDTEGRRATTAGWKGYGEYFYYTNKNGTCYVNKTIDGIKLDALGRTKMSTMDMKAQGYSSNTNYLVLCDKSTYTVCIYKGSKGNWTRIKGPWNCTHGGSRTPAYTSDGKEKYITFTGRLTKRSATWGWGDFEYTSAAFCMNLSSGNFFHSVLFNKGSRSNPYNLSPVDGNLRTNWSHGCIRLALPNAEWVWDNIPAGTRAVVYNS